MKSVQETVELLDRLCTPLPAERIELRNAPGRILREDIVADEDQPPFSRSAMDGYLVRADETKNLLQLQDEVPPGASARMPEPGHAIRIFTGSAVPAEGVAVVMQEDVNRDGNTITLQSKPGQEYIRLRGTHARKGDILVPAGSRLTPGQIALLASTGNARPLVSPVVRVAHIATGSEIVDCDKQPEEGQIRNSNSPMIAALLRQAGAECTFHRRIDESPDALQTAIEEALATGINLLLVSGGASVGDHDHTRTVLRETGFDLLVESVKSRPGKPLIVGMKEAVPVFGLPGNPLSHFVCFHLFVRRTLSRLLGGTAPSLVRMRVADAHTVQSNPRESWLPCRVICDDAGMTVQPLPWRDSSDLTALAQVQGLLRVPPEGLDKNGSGDFLPTGNF